MSLSPTLDRALVLQLVVLLDHGGHKVVWFLQPFGRKAVGPGKLLARIRVVLQRNLLGPVPDISETRNKIIALHFSSKMC